MEYHVRFVHKIAPRDTDTMQATLPDGAFSDRKTLGKALRDAKVMHAGCRVETFRAEGNRIVVFPTCPGMSTYWHSIILTACVTAEYAVRERDAERRSNSGGGS